jgi:DNA-binding CsgD family transcriptional regulator/PAS domain-containing protein
LVLESELMRLALTAYEAASQPTLWPRFLELYCDAVGSDTCILQVHDLGRNRSDILAGFGISSPMTQAYNEHYSKLNVWRTSARALWGRLYAPGMVNLDAEYCPHTLFERSEFYNDYLRHMGVAYCMAAVITRRQNHAPTLTCLRGLRKGEYAEEERQIGKFLLPHLCRAWTVYEQLEIFAAGESILDKLPVGVVFLNSGGVAMYCNRAAEEIFRANEGLSLQAGMVCAEVRSADGLLRRALHDALSPGRQLGQAAVAVPRTSGRRSYQVVMAPVRTRFRHVPSSATPLAVALITDPERPALPKIALLMQLYGLTPKEAALAGKLADGESVEQAAEEMGMRYQTARTHLRHIFSKTGTSRQTELLLLVARLPASRED